MKIALCGPYPRPGDVIGGGELANARTHRALAGLGFRVVVLPKPQRRRRTLLSGLGHAIACLRYYGSCALAARRRRCRMVHYMAFYDQLAPFELLLLITCRLAGLPLVYSVCGGAFVPTYRRRGRLYRCVIDTLLSASAAILAEGEADRRWIMSTRAGRAVHHYPNFVPAGRLTRARTAAPGDALRILHASRLVPNKGVERSLALADSLRATGLRVQLLVCGVGEAAYLASLRACPGGSHPDTSFLGHLAQDELLQCMDTCHFFSFPSSNPMEGQSNALTEALSRGLIPVFSDAGFTRDVVDGHGIEFDHDTAITSAAVAAMWRHGIAGRRAAIIDMARRRYSQPVAMRGLILAYADALRRPARAEPADRPANP